MDVLVTGAEERQGITIARSLGRRGLKVLLGGCDEHSIGFYSKHAHRTFIYPSPFEDVDGFVKTVIHEAQKNKVKLIFPAVESTLVCLDRYREEVEKVAPLAAPSSRLLQMAIDKWETMQIAEKFNIPVPKTRMVYSMEEAVAAAREIGYPVAMKPRGSRFHANMPGKLHFKIAYANNEEELVNRLTHFCHDGVYPLIQEFCLGEAECIPAICYQGESLALFQYKRTRELPVSGGTSVVRESMKVNPLLKDYSEKLLKAMNWTGPATVEFKYNRLNNTYKLMEVNGRVHASIALACKAGVDIPYIVYELFISGKKTKVDSYKVGMACRWLRGDIRAFIEFMSGKTKQQFVDNVRCKDIEQIFPSKFKLLGAFLWDFRPTMHYDIENLSDPIPGIVEMKRLMRDQASLWYHSLHKPAPEVNNKVSAKAL